MNQPDSALGRPTRLHTVKGGGGLELCVAEAGNPEGPSLLFVHGFCQSHQAWRKQLQGPLGDTFRLVAMDLRGHGRSAKPEGVYVDGRLWADDVNAVITTLGLKRPLIVGWSFGGVVVADYLRHYGQQNVAGVHFVSALTRVGKPEFFADFGPDFLQIIPGLLSPEPEQTQRAQEAFVALLFRQPLAPAARAEVLGYNQQVPLHVRGGVGQRVEDGDEVLRALKVPVLVTHGLADRLVLPETSRHIASLVKHAELSWYPEAAHSPFWEDAPRFDQELARFAQRCR
jgi:non-heme chloroperoxidase